MGKKSYDVIIVGAGCAGPAAAKKAAELGLSALLIEKARKPGHKNVSGTGLNTVALGDPDLQYICAGPVEREIREMRTYMINAERVTIHHEIPSRGIVLLSIRRDEFDAWHTEQARMAGAEVMTGTAVTDLIQEKGTAVGVRVDSGEEFRAPVIIDSGGVNSVIGRQAGLIPQRAGTDMILYVTAAVELGKKTIDERFGDCIEYYLGPGTQHKVWPWIFPKRDVVTLGTGGYMTDDLITDAFPTVNAYMDNFLNLPVVKKKLEGGRIVSHGLHLEFDGKLPRTTADGLILAGEAGGFVTPFLGEGMPESFFTGIYAAVAAARCIEKKDVSAEALSREFQEQMDANAFLNAFYFVASENKKSILSRTDEDTVNMMQNIVLSGGFITNAIHSKWREGAEKGDIGLVREAADFMDFLTPYRSVGFDFEEIYAKRREGRGTEAEVRILSR
jgi:electron transfer flavoprotein-quinone oxidoreductase